MNRRHGATFDLCGKYAALKKKDIAELFSRADALRNSQHAHGVGFSGIDEDICLETNCSVTTSLR
jgi:hypothetical protein